MRILLDGESSPLVTSAISWGGRGVAEKSRVLLYGERSPIVASVISWGGFQPAAFTFTPLPATSSSASSNSRKPSFSKASGIVSGARKRMTFE